MWLLTVSDEAMKRRERNASFHFDREVVLEETASNFGNHRTNTKLFRFSSFAGRGRDGLGAVPTSSSQMFHFNIQNVLVLK